MPLYEYTCTSCGQTSELLLRSSAETPACPSCGSESMAKEFSVPARAAVRDGAALPISADGPVDCGAPRCCGGGCQF